MITFQHPLRDLQKNKSMTDQNKTREELCEELSSLQTRYDQLKQNYDELIHERETKKEEDVWRSITRYHKLAEQVDAIVWRFDLKNDKWIYVSPQTKRILGYFPEEWLNFQWWVDIMHPDDQAWAPSFCLEKTKQGSWHEFEYRLRHKNGEYIWIYDKVSVEYVDGEPAFLYGVMFDVTSHKIEEKKNEEFALRKLKTAVEKTEASILITDSEGKIEYANPFFSELTGYQPSDYLGQTPRILKSDVHEPEYYEELWQTITSGKTWSGEFYNKKKDGDCYWEYSTISPVMNDANEIINFVAVKTDITSLKMLNEELQSAKNEAEENKARFEALHNATFGGIAIHDNGIILDCNKGLSDMTGYSVDELIGMNGLYLIDEESKETVINKVEEASDKPYEVYGLRKSGEVYPLRLEGRNVPYKGKEVGVVEFRDISIRKRNEQIIKKQNQEFQALNADKDRFISILAHDLKSPMSGLLGLTELMARHGHSYDSAKIVNLSQHINQTAQNIFNLLDDLLAWIRTQSGKTPFNPRIIGLKQLYDEVMGVLSSIAEKKNINVQYQISDDLTVFADKDMLKTILRNLISNGVKFTKEGGNVMIRANHQQDGVVVKVSDTGVGIQPEKTEHIFEGLQNDSETGTANEKGTGFGLLLCREFVEKHGGTIWVESQVGVGSDFYFKLPHQKG